MRTRLFDLVILFRKFLRKDVFEFSKSIDNFRGFFFFLMNTTLFPIIFISISKFFEFTVTKLKSLIIMFLQITILTLFKSISKCNSYITRNIIFNGKKL